VCGSAEVLQDFGGCLVFRVEAALAIVDASLARVVTAALFTGRQYFWPRVSLRVAGATVE
jgi:hypothetical protein